MRAAPRPLALRPCCLRLCRCAAAALFACAGQAGGALVSERCESKHEPVNSKCAGCPPTYGGKLCASTTRYNDQTKAACGCGPTDPVPEAWWSMTRYTAALNCKSLDPEDPLQAWCPQGCGGCYELCSTGGTTQGKNATPGVCHVFKVTNRCGDGYPDRPMWCSNQLSWKECKEDPSACKKEGGTNYYGYPAHFDLQDLHLQISGGLGWDNVEVTFEPVPCTKWKGPQWDCQCKSVEGNQSAGKFLAAREGTSPTRTRRAPDPEGQAEGHEAEEPGLIRNGAPTSKTSTDGRPSVDPIFGGRADPINAGHPPTTPRLVTTSTEGIPSADPSSECAAAHQQCGGLNWTGPACCEVGCLCMGFRSPTYKQCMPQGPRSTCSESMDGAATDVLLLKKHELVDGDDPIDGREVAWRRFSRSAVAGMCSLFGALVAILSVVALRCRRTTGVRLYQPLEIGTATRSAGLVVG